MIIQINEDYISEEEIERFYTTREVLPEDYQEFIDQYEGSIEQATVIDFDNEQIPF